MASAPNRYMMLRAFVLAAVKQAEAAGGGKTPTAVMEDIVLGKFESEVVGGKTLISTSEAGGVATFSLMTDFTPAEIVSLAMEAITWIQQQPDPLNPSLYPPRRIKRLRASFAKATI
jgi:hypothetical protein